MRRCHGLASAAALQGRLMQVAAVTRLGGQRHMESLLGRNPLVTLLNRLRTDVCQLFCLLKGLVLKLLGTRLS